MAAFAVTRRNPFAAVFALAGALAALAVSTFALGAVGLAVTQAFFHAGGVFVLLMAGLLLSVEGPPPSSGRLHGWAIAGAAAALFFGLVVAVKITPLRDFVLRAAPGRLGDLAGVLPGAGGLPAVAVAALLIVATILGVRAMTRSLP